MGPKPLLHFWRPAPWWTLVVMGVMALGPVRVMAASDHAEPDQGAGLGSLTGTVAVADTGQPVAGALVRILGTSLLATTRSTGRFIISDVPAGLVQVSVVAPGYLETTQGDLRVTAGTATSIQIQLQPTPNFMEQVQITASKEALSVGDVPAQANIIDKSQIERRGDVKLTQALVNIPGLIVSTQASIYEDVLLRGMARAGTTFTTTLLLLDGVPQTNSQNGSRGVNLPINDVSSIEVVRGPNSALYGRTAIAGSVNVLTAEPTPEHRATLEAHVGEWDYLEGQARASGPIQNWGGYYLSWASSRNHGYYKQSYNFATKQNALFAKFTFTPDSKSHGKVTFNNVVSDNGDGAWIPVIDGVIVSDLDKTFDPFTNVNIPTSNFHQEELRTTLNYSRQLTSWLEFVEVFGYRAVQYKFEDDGDVIGAPFDLKAQTATMRPFESTADEDIFYQDAHFLIKPRLGSIQNSLLVGASYERTTGFSAGNNIYTDSTTLGWPVNYVTGMIPSRGDWKYLRSGGNDYKLSSRAAFGQYIISPARRLLLNVGARYDHFDLNNVQTFATGQPRIDKTYHAFSPKVSATLKLLGTETGGGKGALNAYAVYSKAFLNPRSPSALRPLDQTLTLEPERVRNYEAGLKSNLFGGKLSLEGTLFKMKRDGVVLNTRQQSGILVPSNGGTYNLRGVEVGATWLPIPELSLYANGAFYHNRFGDFVTVSGTEVRVLTGLRLPISPDRVYNAGATLQHPSGWEATLNVLLVGDTALDQRNITKFDPFTLLNASLSWKHETVRLTLAAHNLFDKVYFNNGDISNGQAADPGPPRQVILNASVSFK